MDQSLAAKLFEHFDGFVRINEHHNIRQTSVSAQVSLSVSLSVPTLMIRL